MPQISGVRPLFWQMWGRGWFSGLIREQCAFTWNGQEHSFTVLLQASVNFPILSHGIIQRDLDNPQAITWIHHISATMLIEEGKDEVASILEALFKKKKCTLEGGR